LLKKYKSKDNEVKINLSLKNKKVTSVIYDFIVNIINNNKMMKIKKVKN
jgi:hypothetical protein